MNRFAPILFRLATALLLVGILWWALDFAAIAQAIKKLDVLTLILATALMLAGLPFAAWRWHVMLDSAGARVPWLEALRITFVSMIAALGLPSAHASDVVRGLILKAGNQATTDRILSSLIADRIYGILSIALVALPGLALMIGRDQGQQYLWLGLLFCICAVLSVPILRLLVPPLERLVRPPSADCHAGSWQKTRIATADTLLGLQFAFADIRTVAMALGLSLVVHGLAVLSAWMLGNAIGITAPVWAYLVFVPAVWIITMVPLSIGGVGVREVSFALLFQTVGVPIEQGTALGAMVSVTSILGILAGGALSLFIPSGTPASDD